ncbi:hypothetical protein [Streptomyces sp. NPDC046862]|uniref:hypothetical protein n=1 Tax=Streptomyces sp. NPDC046862 TaxID=3154603 RepID=UPI003455350B
MADAIPTMDREPARAESAPTSGSTRHVIEHALTIYFDGNAELARTLIDRLLSESEGQ